MTDSNKKTEKCGPETDKYKMTMKLVNKILENLNKDQIDDLTKFKDIDRLDILKDENKKSFMDMESEIFKLFDKRRCGYYQKSDIKILNCLRAMLKDMGYGFEHTKKEIYEKINGENYRKSHMFYSIK